VNSIVHIAHTTIQFPQNNDTFLCRFPYLVKSPKNASIFCGFLCNMEKLQSCNNCYKRFTEKSQSCNRAGEKDRSLSHNSIHTYIHTYLYIHIKELRKELRQGAALELRLDINWSCIGAALPLLSCKNLDLKILYFFFLIKNHIFKKR
jgi:hypothetical protein